MRNRTAQLKLKPIMGLAALWSVVLMPIPAAAQGTPEQRAACESDATRLCGQFVPDIQRITSCMAQKRRYLSPGCRAVFDGGATRRRRTGIDARRPVLAVFER
jgi:type II secretory pathway component PulL